uniref:Uncharacterized protein n=1 Tax=Trichobilharzia regenti TaxID=157069 RepID=A0AA85J9S7_TRIRE|nr:unnamed protein product [Trichobilharzia regenti]
MGCGFSKTLSNDPIQIHCCVNPENVISPDGECNSRKHEVITPPNKRGSTNELITPISTDYDEKITSESEVDGEDDDDDDHGDDLIDEGYINEEEIGLLKCTESPIRLTTKSDCNKVLKTSPCNAENKKGFISFDINLNESDDVMLDSLHTCPLPKHLKRLEPLDRTPKITTEMLMEKLDKAEEKRKKALERWKQKTRKYCSSNRSAHHMGDISKEDRSITIRTVNETGTLNTLPNESPIKSGSLNKSREENFEKENNIKQSSKQSPNTATYSITVNSSPSTTGASSLTTATPTMTTTTTTTPTTPATPTEMKENSQKINQSNNSSSNLEDRLLKLLSGQHYSTNVSLDTLTGSSNCLKRPNYKSSLLSRHLHTRNYYLHTLREEDIEEDLEDEDDEDDSDEDTDDNDDELIDACDNGYGDNSSSCSSSSKNIETKLRKTQISSVEENCLQAKNRFLTYQTGNKYHYTPSVIKKRNRPKGS